VPSFSVLLKFLGAHPVEYIVQVHLLRAVYPLARCIDLAVSLDRRNNGGRRYLNLSGLFDDPLQGCPDVPLALRE
jgi:hypothetical protein